jgi:hypothetical protein
MPCEQFGSSPDSQIDFARFLQVKADPNSRLNRMRIDQMPELQENSSHDPSLSGSNNRPFALAPLVTESLGAVRPLGQI